MMDSQDNTFEQETMSQSQDMAQTPSDIAPETIAETPSTKEDTAEAVPNAEAEINLQPETDGLTSADAATSVAGNDHKSYKTKLEVL